MNISQRSEKREKNLMKFLLSIKNKTLSIYGIASATHLDRIMVSRLSRVFVNSGFFSIAKGGRNAKLHSLTFEGTLWLFSKVQIKTNDAKELIYQKLKQLGLINFLSSDIKMNCCPTIKKIQDFAIEKSLSRIIKEVNFDHPWDYYEEEIISQKIGNYLYWYSFNSHSEYNQEIIMKEQKQFVKENYPILVNWLNSLIGRNELYATEFKELAHSYRQQLDEINKINKSFENKGK